VRTPPDLTRASASQRRDGPYVPAAGRRTGRALDGGADGGVRRRGRTRPGRAAGAVNRVPFYALGGAVVFVTTLVTLEDPEEGGVPILTSTVAVTVIGFALLALGGEGVIYGARDPGRLGTSLVAYFVAAALVCTGSVYWGLNHWREFTA